MTDLHPYAAYWNQGAKNVPDMTGAKRWLDASDMRQVLPALGCELPLRGQVLDVGCGTGRLAQLCAGTYTGLDIAPSAVEYCCAAGVTAHLIAGADDVISGHAVDLVTCISVFTHIDRNERQEYLTAFAVMAEHVVVDIIPGDGRGEVALWTADPDVFVSDCDAAGFDVVASVDHAWDQHLHRYYRLARRAL